MLKTKGSWFPKDVILQAVYLKLRFSLSYRDIEEILKDRGLGVDHATIQRWVIKYTPELEKSFHRKKRRIGKSWRLDETYIKVKGKWTYYYRAVDKQGNTIDFFLSERRNKTAAKRFLAKAIKRNSKASIINIDKSGANTAGIIKYNKLKQKRIKIRRCKYLNNIVEQDHRFIKRITRPMLGFKNFVSAAITLVGIELVRMLHKGQSRANNMRLMTLPERFRLLAA
jgi:putative transposase